SRHAHVRDLDEFERRFMHVGFELLVPFPVAISLLQHDAPFQEQALEDLVDVELGVLCVAHAERDILEVAEKRHVYGIARCAHFGSLDMAEAVLSHSPVQTMTGKGCSPGLLGLASAFRGHANAY